MNYHHLPASLFFSTRFRNILYRIGRVFRYITTLNSRRWTHFSNFAVHESVSLNGQHATRGVTLYQTGVEDFQLPTLLEDLTLSLLYGTIKAYQHQLCRLCTRCSALHLVAWPKYCTKQQVCLGYAFKGAQEAQDCQYSTENITESLTDPCGLFYRYVCKTEKDPDFQIMDVAAELFHDVHGMVPWGVFDCTIPEMRLVW